MVSDWTGRILDLKAPQDVWLDIFGDLCELALDTSSPVVLHDETVSADRLLAEAAWDLWHAYPQAAVKASAQLRAWASHGTPRAVLVLDALSLREFPVIVEAAGLRGITPLATRVVGSECPSTTDHFARAIGISSRSALANDGKPAGFPLFGGDCFTNVLSIPFEDCAVPPAPYMVLWHTWLDDLIHLQQKLPDQVTAQANAVLRGDGLWSFVNKLRRGRDVVITSDHGYAVSRRFSSEVEDPEAVEILRATFGASRYKSSEEPWPKRFMPPIVMTEGGYHVVVGQRKWRVQGGFPSLCHGGMSLLEVAVPWIELGAI